MTINFNISEFNISRQPIPQEICDKILKWHISPMIEVRKELDVPIWPSQESGYRPKSWEISKGRNGNSEHCFEEKGAVDWTCKDFQSNGKKLLESIIKYTDYTRIAVYNNFIHCDYKQTPSGRREQYSSGADSKWVFKKTL